MKGEKKEKKEQVEENVKVEVTNQIFADKNKEFQDACSYADVRPTSRQASKFRNKKGKAYLVGLPIIKTM